MRLKDKVAIITGGSRGIGFATAERFLQEGAKVIITASSEENAKKSAARLKELYPDSVVDGISPNLSSLESVRKEFKKVTEKYGCVDILVNNAGNHCKKYIEDMTVEDYVNVLNVHLVGAFALTKALFPHMKEQGKGSILFQASMTSYIGQPQVAGYATAKAGYLGLVHTLAAEGGPYGVRVNAIAPGWIDTPMFHKATDGDQVRLGKILGRIPMQKVGSVTDIGMAAVFLSSDAAGYISGTCLPVDGGALIGF